jgi:hypothetical protein
MDDSEQDYFSHRANAERARAGAATCVEAERAHLELAGHYRAKLDAARAGYEGLAEEQARQHEGAQLHRIESRGLQLPLLRN